MNVRFGQLTAPAIRQAALEGAFAVVPLGCTEQHARHLPVGTDTFQVEGLAVRGAERAQAAFGVRALVLPALPYGPASEHHGLPGVVHLPNELWVAVIKAVLQSLLDGGFRRIAVIQGCGGHWAAPGAVWDVRAECARRGVGAVLRVADAARFFKEAAEEQLASGRAGGGHAGVLETSLMLAYRADWVDAAAMEAPRLGDLEGRYRQGGEAFLFSEMSTTGGLGDPAGATAEAGRVIWERAAEAFARWLAKADRQDRELGRVGGR